MLLLVFDFEVARWESSKGAAEARAAQMKETKRDCVAFMMIVNGSWGRKKSKRSKKSLEERKG